MNLHFYRLYGNTRYEIVAPNIYMDWATCEMDLLGVRKSGFIDEVEIKVTKSDFVADFKKRIRFKTPGLKHDLIPEGKLYCNYFSFFIPVALVDQCDIPDYAGLYVFDNSRAYSRVRELKRAPRLHDRKITDKQKYQVTRKVHYRYWQTMSLPVSDSRRDC
jgi:hypothetical protein